MFNTVFTEYTIYLIRTVVRGVLQNFVFDLFGTTLAENPENFSYIWVILMNYVNLRVQGGAAVLICSIKVRIKIRPFVKPKP